MLTCLDTVPVATFPKDFTSQRPVPGDDTHPFIGIEPVVKTAIAKIREHCSSKRHIDERTPPIMISSMARSGKTTLLRAVYNELAAGEEFEAIIVTFNGQSGFMLNEEEEDVAGFCRGVYEQLLGSEGFPSADALIGYLDLCTKPLVLLVDELNALTSTISASLADLLRCQFLDHPRRYLVFTSHYPMSLTEALGSRPGSSESPRSCVTISVPKSLVIDDYQPFLKLSRQISPVELALWGGLCGLAWSIMKTEFSPTLYFAERVSHVSRPPQDEETQRAFYNHVCNGCPDELMRPYLRFTYVSNDGSQIWPLCYIAAFLKCARQEVLSDFLSRLTSECQSIEQCSGLEWQAIVLAAVAIRIFSESFSGTSGVGVSGVIGCIPKGTPVRLVQLPREVVEVTHAESYILDRAVTEGKPSVVLAYAAAPSFEAFDGLIFHYDGNHITDRRGLQAKQGKVGADSDAPDGYTGFLLRGQPPMSKGRVKNARWKYLTREEVMLFMPLSLKGLVPFMWPSGNAVPDGEAEGAASAAASSP